MERVVQSTVDHDVAQPIREELDLNSVEARKINCSRSRSQRCAHRAGML